MVRGGVFVAVAVELVAVVVDVVTQGEEEERQTSLADCSDDDPLRRYETIKCSIISNSRGDRSISARLESMKTSLDDIKA